MLALVYGGSGRAMLGSERAWLPPLAEFSLRAQREGCSRTAFGLCRLSIAFALFGFCHELVLAVVLILLLGLGFEFLLTVVHHLQRAWNVNVVTKYTFLKM